jgi:hypothetical protein
MRKINVEREAEKLAAATGLPIEEAREQVAIAAGLATGDDVVPGPRGEPRRSPSPLLHELTDA